MIDVHYWTTPNGHKVTIFLEEAGLPYKIFPVNIGKGEQFQRAFLEVSPNNRIPAIVDRDPPGGVNEHRDPDGDNGIQPSGIGARPFGHGMLSSVLKSGTRLLAHLAPRRKSLHYGRTANESF